MKKSGGTLTSRWHFRVRFYRSTNFTLHLPLNKQAFLFQIWLLGWPKSVIVRPIMQEKWLTAVTVWFKSATRILLREGLENG